MTAAIIIAFCSLLLIAYLFDLSAAKTKIPSVILLLILGFVVKKATEFMGIEIPDLSGALAVLATIGLVLIVLEGSLELEIDRSKLSLVSKSFVGALLSILILSFAFALIFQYVSNQPLKVLLINAIPLSIISSAIAIPSVKNLGAANREFVTYESSLSDIIGVLFFNFILRNTVFGFDQFAEFGLSIVFMTVISLIATIALSIFLSKINHHIKFAPIILLVILIYEISKVYHLPALLFILLFGLALGNIEQLKNRKFFSRFKPDELHREVKKFKELAVEATFIIRVLFFLLFGYLLEAEDVLNTESLVWSVGIVVTIFTLRVFQIWLSRLPIMPLLFVAPRGLITILLFISISPVQTLWVVNRSLITQVIILTSLIMMVGLMAAKRKDDAKKPLVENDENGKMLF